MSSRIRNTLQSWERRFFRVLTVLLIVIVGVAIWLARVGLPESMADALMRRIDTGQFAVEASSIRLGVIKGVRLNGVSVYHKGIVGPPAVEAESVILCVDPLAVLRGMSSVRSVTITDGLVRPSQAYASEDMAAHGTLGTYQTELVLTQCSIQGVMVESLRGQLHLRDTKVELDSLQATLARDGMRGTASGQVGYDAQARTVYGQVSASMYPAVVEPVLDAWALDGLASIFQRFTFDKRPPTASLAFRVSTASGGPLSFDGDVHLESGRYRGVEAIRADAGLSVVRTNGAMTITLDPLTVVRREGSLQGTLAVERTLQQVRFDVRSSMTPPVLSQALNLPAGPFWDRWSFDGPTVIGADGVVGYNTWQGTDLTLTFDGRELAYTNHPIDYCRFTAKMVDNTISISRIRAGTYGGEVTGRIDVTLPDSDAGSAVFDSALNVTNMNFERVAAVLHGKSDQEYRGRLSGHLALQGQIGKGKADTVHGRGSVLVDDGRVFMLPVFGGLSEIMTRLIPGLDFVLRQSDAAADFTVANSKVSSEKIEIEGTVLSLKGRGQCHFDKTMDFHVQIKLMTDNNMVARLVRMLTFPISKLFEFRLRGTWDDPRWYPVNFSGDLLQKLGLRKQDT